MHFPQLHMVKKYMPEAFKFEYTNTRLIVDATEFSVDILFLCCYKPAHFQQK